MPITSRLAWAVRFCSNSIAIPRSLPSSVPPHRSTESGGRFTRIQSPILAKIPNMGDWRWSSRSRAIPHDGERARRDELDNEDRLNTVFENGKVLVTYDLDSIRERAQVLLGVSQGAGFLFQI